MEAGLLFVYRKADMHFKDTVLLQFSSEKMKVYFPFTTLRAINFANIQIHQEQKRWEKHKMREIIKAKHLAFAFIRLTVYYF